MVPTNRAVYKYVSLVQIAQMSTFAEGNTPGPFSSTSVEELPWSPLHIVCADFWIGIGRECMLPIERRKGTMPSPFPTRQNPPSENLSFLASSNHSNPSNRQNNFKTTANEAEDEWSKEGTSIRMDNVFGGWFMSEYLHIYQ
jgi:hypothetical protein